MIPLVLLCLAEVGLRIAGCGYKTSFFIEADGVYAVNKEFGLRFFPRSLVRPPWPAYVDTRKAPGACRIFVMGGSAAQGVPDPAFGFAEILKTMLTDTYPRARSEVAVAAVTAINSHVVLPIARDCAAHEPDLFIVYLGNNEVVGPFGPGTVFQGFTPSLRLIRAYLAAQTTKLGQLAVDFIARLPGKKSPKQWTGMDMFMDNLVSADDPRLPVVYEHLRRNLQDICRTGRKAGADTILCTVAVDLRHCAPFASTHGAGLSDSDLARWDSAFRAGVELDEAGDPGGAIEKYLAAEQIDGRYAELQFRLGRRYLAVGEPGLARYAFALAGDLDALRFRADSDVNRVIREVAAGEGSRVRLVDAERAMATCDSSPDGLPGEELFFEHVHMTFDGNYEVARAIFPAAVSFLPGAIRSQGPADPAPPPRQRCAKLMSLTPWRQRQMLAYMLRLTDGPPHTNQFDHAQRRSAMEELHRMYESQIDDDGSGAR